MAESIATYSWVLQNITKTAFIVVFLNFTLVSDVTNKFKLERKNTLKIVRKKCQLYFLKIKCLANAKIKIYFVNEELDGVYPPSTFLSSPPPKKRIFDR